MVINTIDSKRISRQDKFIALFLAGITILLLVVTAADIGLTWDEPTYIVAAEKYPAWFGELFTHPLQAVTQEEITKYWEFNHEHPPLSKVWSGIVWLGARYLFDDLTAHRLGNILLAGVLVATIYLLLARESGRTAGIVGAAALITMPRFFFHAHLAALDVPVAVMVFIVIYVFWIGRNHPDFRWTLLLGLLWGLALATKINGLFIPPIVLAAWVLLFRPRPYLFGRIMLMGFIGVGFFILSWPWLYHETFNRLMTYLGFFTIDRYLSEQYYFGNLYSISLPWHFPFVTALIVVPFSLLLLSTIGVVYSLRSKDERPLGALLLLGAFISVLVPAFGPGKVFDNERLLMPLFPFLAALAGLGFAHLMPLVQRLIDKRNFSLNRGQLVFVLAAVLFAPHLLLSYDLYPHLLSYYSEAVGGAYGAKALRLETTYWCESYAKTLPYLNNNTPPEAIIWAECQDVLIYYQLHGKLRPDLQIANGPEATTAFSHVQLNPATFKEADYAVIQYRQSGFYRALNEWVYARNPVFEYKYRRLRLAEIYHQ
jgi:4-amino-4-deoxy-L-arabinose transferase-like glycosyltransferase